MTVATIALTVGDFTVESLGVDYPDYFQGYGLGPSSEFDFCAYGIGNTEEEALADCIEMAAQQGFDIDEETESRIRADYGDCDDSTTAAEALGLNEDEVDDEFNAYFHVGIKWNCRQDQRLLRIRKIRALQPLRYEDYRRFSDGCWDNVTRANGDVSYGDLKETDYPENAEKYLEALSADNAEVYFFVPESSGSDYSGSTVSRSNYLVFTETYGKDSDWVFSAHGGFSTYAAVVGLTGLLGCDEDTFDEVCNVLEGLEDYPLINDEALSTLEMEGADEAWNSWVAGDFRRALEKKFDCAEFEWPSDSDLRTFFEKKAEKANEYWFNEGYGPDMYIRVDKIVEGIDFDAVAEWAICYRVSFCAVGSETEDYASETEAIERVNSLRASGLIGASYTAVKPVKK